MKIKATSANYNQEGTLIVVDDKGRVWHKSTLSDQWTLEDLPDEPEAEY